jgi:hypothetical protein
LGAAATILGTHLCAFRNGRGVRRREQAQQSWEQTPQFCGSSRHKIGNKRNSFEVLFGVVFLQVVETSRFAIARCDAVIDFELRVSEVTDFLTF